MEYGMFTESGSNLVADVVKMAKTYGLTPTVVTAYDARYCYR
jgi:hypothetical protein